MDKIISNYPDSFTHVQLMPNVIQIKDCLGYFSTLMIGEESAFLFDTMSGIGDLRSYVKNLVNLPVNVALSHAHFDHLGGAFLFDEVYLSKKEMANVQMYFDHKINEIILHKARQETQFNEEECHGVCQDFQTKFLELKEGMIFDLGDLHLQAISLPGHTPGSMGILCQELGVLLSGDAMTPIMCLFFEESLSVEDYLNTLEKAKGLCFDYLITSHHNRLFKKEWLETFHKCAIYSQNNKGMKFQYDLIPEYVGTLHIYSGENLDADDFVAIITKRQSK